MIIFEAYTYLYYRIYSLQLKWFGEEDLPEYTAVISVSLLIWWNIYAALLAVSIWTRFAIIDALNPEKIKMGLLLLLVLFVNYLIFVYKKYYKQIFTRFENESSFEKRTKMVFILLYIIFSFVVPFLL